MSVARWYNKANAFAYGWKSQYTQDPPLTAVVLGGVSIAGGRGRLGSVFVGVLIIGILANGMILLNIQYFYQLVIKGVVLLFAVGLDTLRKA